MKTFKIYHTGIGQIGFDEYEFTNAVFCLHNMAKENTDWVMDYPQAKWSVELYDDE